MQRNRPGTKEPDLFDWETPNIEDIDSSFAIQEYIQAKIRDNATVEELITRPETLDDHIWQYEHLRQITQDLNFLVALLIPVTTPEMFPSMRITDDESYLLPTPAGQSIECSAIDYILHTLSNSETLLNNQKLFPSRITVSEGSVKHFATIARRLFRILAFAKYHHKELFDEFEEEVKLFERFVEFSQKYSLMPKESLVVPVKSG